MLGEGLAAQIELYECFWGNLVIYTTTQLVGTLIALILELCDTDIIGIIHAVP